MSLPDFLVFGAANCASSFLHRNLNEHPDIYMISGEPREACYFEDYEYSKYSFDIIIKAFENIDDNKVLGFKRPTYINRPQSAPRIKKHLPDIKLIAVLRNPMERAVTSYFHHMQENFSRLRK